MCWIIKNKSGEYLLFTISHGERIATLKFARMLKISWPEAKEQGYKCIAVSIKEENGEKRTNRNNSE